MPIKESAVKELRKNKKHAATNLRALATVDRLVRQARKAIGAKNPDGATLAKNLQKVIDKAVAHGIMKRNTAARVKSRLAARLRTQGA